MDRIRMMNENDVVIYWDDMKEMLDRADVVNAMQALLDGAEPPIGIDRCIYRVPHTVRKAKEDAYTPSVVSIGPYHHRTHPRLISTEISHKVLYFKAFLQRTEKTLETIIHYLADKELDIRGRYSETLQLTKEELVKVILVDSCFILELILRTASYRESVDPLAFKLVKMDLLLLENQLPFFVLEGIFNLCINQEDPSLRKLVFRYFSSFNISGLEASDNITIRHFTDLIRIFHLPHPPQRLPERNVRLLKHIPSATQLMEAGLRFKVNTNSHCLLDMRLTGRGLEIPRFTGRTNKDEEGRTNSKCLLDLRFTGRVLEISKLRVDDSTEILFRNMIALEQCIYPYECYITDYVTTMDFLINTGKDVDILVEQEVLDNWLGDTDSVANLFNNLRNGIVLTNFSTDYLTLSEDLNNFCRGPCRQLIATLRRDYCKTPWKTAASIAGVILLILTFIQTVCSVLQVVL